MAKIPFDIKWKPQIESGEYKVETKDHHPVRIICWNKNTGGLDRIVALVAGGSGQEKTLHYTEEGWCVASGGNKNKDLFIITPEPEFTEFEKAVGELIKEAVHNEVGDNAVVYAIGRGWTAKLLELARKEIVKHDDVIEKKTSHGAVEKIYDKHKTERHAVMNWEEFQEVAQYFIDCGKAEALKDLPRWKEAERNIYSVRECVVVNSHGVCVSTYIPAKSLYIAVSDLEKLPKEE